EMRPPDPDLIAWLTAVGSQIGQFIERKRSESSRRQLAAIVESSHDAVIGATIDGRITNWNLGAQRIYGYTAADAIGRQLGILVSDEKQAEFKAIVELTRQGQRTDHYESFRRSRQGTPVHISLSVSPVFDANDRVISLAVIGHDISDRKERETQIRGLNQDLEAQVLKLAVLNAELKTLSQSLARARDQAVEASGIKSQFLANMSHEIRTPMNAIIGMSDLLLHTNLTREQFEFSQMIRESAGNLLEIVNDVLDFSKIEAGKLRLELHEFDIVSVLEGSAELLADKAKQKNLSLMTYVAPDIPRIVRGDQGRLRQVVLNLLSNAIKFTDAGSIVLDARLVIGDDTLATVAISVKDTGIGILQDSLQQIFHPFTQADNSISRKFGGTGLGLSISKRLVELMGGQITAESTEGRGSTFTFTTSFEVAAEQKSEPEPIDFRGTRLLIVEGNEDTARIISSYCQAWNIACDTTTSGAEAISLMIDASSKNIHYDIVIVEQNLPDSDAISFAAQLTNHFEWKAPSLVLFTSGAGAGEFAYDSGKADTRSGPFSAYLSSPLRQSVLFDCIANLSGKTRTLPSRPASDLDEPKIFEAVSGTAARREEKLILLAEDNPVNQKVAMLQLRKLGYTTHAVANGKEAVDA
ncbi:MAG TPA: ATP-binding protein, partial [Chroococcales cyanobacterium]